MMNPAEFERYLWKVIPIDTPGNTSTPKLRVRICSFLYEETVLGPREWLPRDEIVAKFYGDVDRDTREKFRGNIRLISQRLAAFFKGKAGVPTAPIIYLDEITPAQRARTPITGLPFHGLRLRLEPNACVSATRNLFTPPDDQTSMDRQLGRDSAAHDAALADIIALAIAQLGQRLQLPSTNPLTAALAAVLKGRASNDNPSDLHKIAIPPVPYKRIRVEVTNGLASLEVVHLNSAAQSVYAVQSDKRQLIGADLRIILDRLRNWIDPIDWDELVADQERAGSQFAREKYAVARVPMRFNDTHPHTSFRRKRLLPVMTQSHQMPSRGTTDIYYAVVAYIDLDLVPDVQ